jgi:hypothetical protein
MGALSASLFFPPCTLRFLAPLAFDCSGVPSKFDSVFEIIVIDLGLWIDVCLWKLQICENYDKGELNFEIEIAGRNLSVYTRVWL